jgi:acyl-homoserine lactone acylase PvdQ
VDQTQIIAPPGQSGQPGHAHYDDMVERWLDGKLIDLPVNREQVRKMAVAEMVLSP